MRLKAAKKQSQFQKQKTEKQNTGDRRKDIRITGNQDEGYQQTRESGYSPTFSTIVEHPLQIVLILQNKANLLDAQMNVSSALTKDYENYMDWRQQKNKANLSLREQSQFQDATMAFSAYDTRDCHGPSGLEMIFVEVFYKASQELFPVLDCQKD